jgi:hypothetical protein
MSNHDNTQGDAGKALRSTIVAQLAAAGWTALEGGTAIANKMYETAVGLKEAQAYLADYGPTSENYVLQGQYYSEGRNVLGGSGILIPKAGDEATVTQLTQKFAAGAEKEVLQSYAARLLRLRDVPDDQGVEEDDGTSPAPSM